MSRRAYGFVALLAFLAAVCGCSRPKAEQAQDPRVVSLAPNLTEMICALGAGDRLVGRTSACDYPPDVVAKVPVVGGFGAPSMERLVAVRPTLVVEVDLADETAGREMDRLGIRRECIPCRSLQDIATALTTLGRLLGREPRAAELAAQFEAGIARCRADAALVANPPAVFAEIWSDPLMTAGTNSFVSELIALAGGRNIGDAGRKEYYQVSSEWVVSLDPDVVLCLYTTPPGVARERVLARLGWKDVRAVRTGRVYDNLNCDVILRPGPRALEGVAELRRAILGVSP